jgi:hypothetical protein
VRGSTRSKEARNHLAGDRGRPSKSLRITTMIYTHVLNRGPAAVRSPADRLLDR